MIVRVADFVIPPDMADMVADDFVVTFVVFTEKVIDVFPAGIVTEEGTVAAAKLLDSETAIPPVGAAPLIVKVPVELLPPLTVAGLRVSVTRLGGLMVSPVC